MSSTNIRIVTTASTKFTIILSKNKGAWPGPSYFVSGRKYFPTRIVLNVTGEVTLHPQSWEFFPDITNHYRTQ